MTPVIETLQPPGDGLGGAGLGRDLAIDAAGRGLRARRAGDAAFVAGSAVLALADRGDQAAGDAAVGRRDPLAGDTRAATPARSPEAWPPARSGGEIGSRPADRRPRARPGRGGRRPPRTRAASRPWIAPIDWQAWLFLGWGLAVVGQVAAIAHQRNRLERLLRQAAPADDPALLALVAELSGRIGLRRRPKVLIADGEGSPFVCGLRRPTLVLPRGLARSLDPESLRSVLLHELAHIRRRDLLWDWIPAIARLVYFFHPAAHYIVYRARLERELACDQAAMVLTGPGRRRLRLDPGRGGEPVVGARPRCGPRWRPPVSTAASRARPRCTAIEITPS